MDKSGKGLLTIADFSVIQRSSWSYLPGGAFLTNAGRSNIAPVSAGCGKVPLKVMPWKDSNKGEANKKTPAHS